MNAPGRVLLVLLLGAAQSACMTYGGFDEKRLEKPAPAVGAQPLRYSVTGYSVFDGINAIQQTFDKESGFSRTEQVPAQTTPESGLYVRTTVQNASPHFGAAASMYVSSATLFILPAWSTTDGNHVLYDVYREGVHQERYEYRIHRKTFVWLPMVLFVWVNLFTTSESEAFEAVTKQFLVDAHPRLHD